MLGRKIIFKALENRLNHLWARKGSIHIVDSWQHFYLVTFTYEENQVVILTDGPWMIHDHYLTVRGWSINFFPNKNSIEQLVIWVTIYGLPIEYSDAHVLTYIGNKIGKTIKVDRIPLTREHGNYARLCVQISLSNMLLAMFSIKGKHYKIEYEGLHLLCLDSGRYGHYAEHVRPRQQILWKSRLIKENGWTSMNQKIKL